MATGVERRKLDLSNPRYWHQNARMAIRDIYDALTELITNADDRYVRLDVAGRIEIEIERRRKGSPSTVRLRDFADGMTTEDMDRKIGRVGDRVSGLADGAHVRGTNSRGAKDVAILGGVRFDSIGSDGQYHRCEVTPQGEFLNYGPSSATKAIREELGIPRGTGTLVTVTVAPPNSVPQHEKLCESLQHLVSLREIISDPSRTLVVRDVNQEREHHLRAPVIDGVKRLAERISIPGYPDAEAKLVIKRTSKRLDCRNPRFRLGGVVVKSRHAVHESTFFAPELEHDPHAAWFYGRLTCDYIDELSNEYDDRFEQGLEASEWNPQPIVDPMRKGGLNREHPFVQQLLKESLRRFRPLVDEERKQQEHRRARVESDNTRRRLDALQREAAKFMERNLSEDDPARDPDDGQRDTSFRKRGFSLSPPYAQIVLGHSRRFWFNLSQDAFPEYEEGSAVQITCLSPDVSVDHRVRLLEVHPTLEKTLRCVFSVRGVAGCDATGVAVRLGSIVADSAIEVIESEREKYTDVEDLQFEHKRYRLKQGQVRVVRILAPYPAIISAPTPVDVACSSSRVRVKGEAVLRPHEDSGVAICKLKVQSDTEEFRATLEANAGRRSCAAELLGAPRQGIGIKITLVPDDFGNDRSRWRSNILEISAKHPSVRRYLGLPSENFPGQESVHFRLLLAEIVAESVCQRIIGRNVQDNPADYEDHDWAAYFAEYSKYMTEFLPIAHRTQVPDSALNGR